MTTKALKFWQGYRFTKVCLTLVFLSVITPPGLLAQTAATGALTGTLKDASGAVVPNATVTATNIGTSQSRTTTTDADGTYKFGLMPPGNYSVKFAAAGFNTEEAASVAVVVTETSVLDQSLQVGAQTQQVEVRGEAEAVQTASSTVGTVVNSEIMTATPLTSRNYTNLLGLSAGANSGVYDAANLGKGSQDIAVNGSGTAQNNLQQDGASIQSFSGRELLTDQGSNGGPGIVNPDAIEEFKIQTSLYDAGYGKKPGANVNVVTKSGTNQFHGTAFEFFRNTALNANDFFRKLSPAPNNTRQVLNQNQFGGVFGGAVKKDRLFFFVSYQETRQKNGISPSGYSNPTLVGIPMGDRSNTAAFEAALGAAFCPGGSATAGTTGKTSNGGTQVACSGSNINPVAINILQLKNPNGTYFIPGSTTGINQNTTFSIPATFTEHQPIGNLDYVVDDKNTLSARWFYAGGPENAPMGCGTGSTSATQCLPGSPGSISFSTQYATLKLTSILSSNVVNEARLSLQRFVPNLQNKVPFTDTQVGIAPVVPSISTLDTITISGLMQLGAVSTNSTENAITQWEAADQISWSRGKHTIRAGVEFARYRAIWALLGTSIGSLTFQTFQDFLLGLPGCAPSLSSTACAASAAAGLTNGTSTSNVSNTGTTTAVTGPAGLRKDFRYPAESAFVQDDYKVLSNLTLNLGLRWEYNGLTYDAAGDFTNVWPSLINTVPVPGTTPATGTLAGFVVPSNFNFAGNPQPPVGGVFQNIHKYPTQSSPSLKNFAPRVGFAWRPLASDRFVVRGGGGYFYDQVGLGVYSRMAQGYPYAQTVSASGAATYFSTLAQPYAATSLGWAPRWVNINPATQTGTSSNLNAYIMAPNYLNPLTYEWSMNIQYEFLPRWVLELGYVGSRGIHQVPNISLAYQDNEAQLASPANPVNGITTNTVANASLRVPYLGFAPGGLQSAATIGDNKFNSLQATVRKQLSHGVQLQAAYTWARAFTTTDYYGYDNPDLPFQYGLNPSYRPQRLTVNYSWDLPLGNHEGLAGKVANGWNLAGVTVVQDGTPLTVEDTRGGSIYGFGSGAVQISTAEFAAGMGPANVGTPGTDSQRLGGSAGGAGYFSKAAFSTTPVIGNGTGYGNSGLGIILGPSQFNFDATIQKTTKVGGINEDANVVFRAEFFNLFNHPQFSNPTGSQTDISKSTFGQITLSSVNPRLIQFALKYVF
jgi:hypothetical protein